MKKILITGGLGFMGSNLVRYLYKKYPDYHIDVLDCMTYAGNSGNNIPEHMKRSNHRFVFWCGNILNSELVAKLVEQADTVIHLAAETHVTRSIFDNKSFFETDVLGTQSVTNVVANQKDHLDRFIHISTSEVYGTAHYEPMDEEHPLNPLSPYAAAKCGADRLVHSYWNTYGIPSVIIRPFNNYGPYQHLEKLIPRFITSCILNEPLTVHGDGLSMRDFVYVEDFCEAVDKAIHADIEKIKGQVINVGTGKSYSVNDIADIITDKMHVSKTLIQHIGDRPGQVFKHISSTEKAKKLLEWEAKTSFLEGIDKAIEWYVDNRKWWETQLWMRSVPIISASGKREYH
jgi:dTDP-glucose 4,6-dehydratase